MDGQRQPQDIYQNPIFEETDKKRVLQKHKEGIYTRDDLDLYKHGNLVRENSFLGAPKDSVLYLYKQGYFSKGQLNMYKEFYMHGEDPDYKPHPGVFVLDQLISGRKPEDIEAELGGLDQSVYDPIDLAVDVSTGGFWSIAKTGAKQLAKMGAKQATKKVATDVAIDVSLGMAGGAGMAAVEEAGGGWIMQTLGGLVGGMGASAIATGGRQGFIRFMRRAKKENPELFEDVSKAIRGADDPAADVYRQYLDDLEDAKMSTARPYEFVEEVTEVSKAGMAVAKTEPAKKNPKPMRMTRENVESILKVMKDGTADDTSLMKQIQDTNAHGADLFKAIDTVCRKQIDAAKGSMSNASSKQLSRKMQKEMTKFSDEFGHRVVDLEKAFVDVNDMAASMHNMHSRLDAHGSMLTKIASIADTKAKEALESDNFQKMLEAEEWMKLLGEYDNAIQLVRSQYGRGLQFMNRKWQKTRYDFESIPKIDLDSADEIGRRALKDRLKRYRDAEGTKGKRLVAADQETYRYLKAAHEWQIGAMLMHPKTWAVNIVGNSLANAMYTSSRLAAAGLKGDLGKAIDAEKLAWTSAWSTLFSAPSFKRYKKARGLGVGRGAAAKAQWVNMMKDMDAEGSGTFWRALWSGDGVLDPHQRYEGQAGSSLEYIQTHLWQDKKGNWKAIPERARRLLFMPLTKYLHHGLHVLTAGDEMFKTLAYYQKKNSMLYREALKLKDPSSMADYIAKRSKQMNYDDPIEQAAIKEFRDVTFVTPLSGASQSVEKFMSGSSLGWMARITTLPFYKIAVNLNKFALKNSALGVVSKEVRGILKKGTPEEKAEVMTRMAMGSSLVLAGALFYANKWVTGRFDRKDWSAKENANLMEYSAINRDSDGRVSGFVDFSRLDPLSINFCIGAGLAETGYRLQDLVTDDKTEDEFDDAMVDAVVAGGLAFLDPTLNRSFMQSLEGTVNLYYREGSNFGKWSAMQAKKFIPRDVDIINSVLDRDEYRKEIRGVGDQLLNSVWPKALPDKRHAVYGTPIKKEDAFIGMARSRKSDDPVMHELARVGVQAPPMDEEVRLQGETKRLTPQQYDKMTSYLQEMGLKETLAEVMESLEGVGDDQFKASMYQRYISDARNMAKMKFLSSEFGLPVMDSLVKAMDMRALAIEGKKEKRNARTRFYRFLNEE